MAVGLKRTTHLTTATTGNENQRQEIDSTQLPLQQETISMGGPIVRTGTTPAFWSNWEKAFGKASKQGSKAGPKKSAAKKPAKSAKPKAARKGKKKKR
jgi:hypothetical protein